MSDDPHDRSRHVADLPTTTERRVIRVDVHHIARRGFSVSVLPVTLHEDGKGFGYDLMTGVRRFIEPAPRFDRRRLVALASEILGRDDVRRMIRQECESESLVLAEPLPGTAEAA